MTWREFDNAVEEVREVVVLPKDIMSDPQQGKQHRAWCSPKNNRGFADVFSPVRATSSMGPRWTW
eukprot:271442-Pyramimonas_sp.AAC.1